MGSGETWGQLVVHVCAALALHLRGTVRAIHADGCFGVRRAGEGQGGGSFPTWQWGRAGRAHRERCQRRACVRACVVRAYLIYDCVRGACASASERACVHLSICVRASEPCNMCSPYLRVLVYCCPQLTLLHTALSSRTT